MSGPLSPPRPSIAGRRDQVATELDDLEHSIARFRAGKVPEAVFLEYRLRHGVYGQRQDGVHMLRSKLPLGLVHPDQLDAFADIAETYGHGIAHLTTRQDIQVHFVGLEQTPDLQRVLADAEATAREACGNVVRNVTASTDAGVSQAEPFDVTAYGMALAQFLLRHPDGQSLGRKFKITLASSFDPSQNLAAIHDLGATAVIRDGTRGFHVRVGGGLGAVPHEAPVLTEFLAAEELLPTALAMLRLFARHGEKAKRARARLKFLVAKWGIELFRQEVAAERAQLRDDPAWRQFELERWTDTPLHAPADASAPRSDAEAAWRRTNVHPQRQEGYAQVHVTVPRGDLDPTQLRGLARLLREHVGDTTRIGVDQSLRIRWVAADRLSAVYDGLAAVGLAGTHAGGISDPVTCPGADTCKLGITSPRRATRSIQAALDALTTDPRIAALRIHVSGCPNSCAQHQIADIGFFGASRTVAGHAAPHFVLMLGGRRDGVGDTGAPGSGFALPITKVPAARMQDAVQRVARAFLARSTPEEAFGDWVRREGRAALKAELADLGQLPPIDEAPQMYREAGSDAPFAVQRGVGECAGEVVLLSDLLLSEADREADAALALLDDGGAPAEVRARAKAAFSAAARALLSTEGLTDPRSFDELQAFRDRYYDAGRIFEGVGHYYLEAMTEESAQGDRLRRLAVEAGLFVEEAHTIVGRLAPEVSA
ncbi:MAG: nitrite/sulfite reductase [Myxococcales bacterium]|nr:nitrite/sulfite reductase [Myxococcales bacterium]